MTAISAMQLGILSATEVIDGPPEITLFNTVFTNFQKENNGLITLPTALEVSSDTYFYQVGDRFWHLHANVESQSGNPNSGLQQQDWAERFGFGATTGLDLPGEDPGRVPTPAWKASYFGALGESTMETWLPGDNINMAVGPGQPAGDPAAAGVGLRGHRQRRQHGDADARHGRHQSERAGRAPAVERDARRARSVSIPRFCRSCARGSTW